MHILQALLRKSWVGLIVLTVVALSAQQSVAQNNILFQSSRDCADGSIDLATRLESCNRVVSAQGLEPDEMAIGYVNLGLVYQAQKNDGAALVAFDKALTFEPNLWEGLIDRGFLNLRRGDIDAALADWKTVSGPGVSGTYEDIRDIAHYRPVKNGELHDADSPDRDAAIRADGIAKLRDAVANELCERCRMRALTQSHMEEAMADCNTALTIVPGNPIALASRGFAEFVQGDYRASEKDLEGAPPELAAAVFYRGLAKHRLGDKAGGDADIAAAEKLQPGLTAEMKAHGLSP